MRNFNRIPTGYFVLQSKVDPPVGVVKGLTVFKSYPMTETEVFIYFDYLSALKFLIYFVCVVELSYCFVYARYLAVFGVVVGLSCLGG